MKEIISTEYEKRVFILGCLTLLVFLVYRGVYIPIKNTDASIQEDTFTLEKKLHKAHRSMSEIKPFQKEYPEIISCFKQSLPDKQQLGSITKDLESLAHNKGLTITSKTPVKSKAYSYGNDFSINILLIGDAQDIVGFLYTLQNCPYFYSVHELDLGRMPSSETLLQCRLKLTKTLVK